MKPHSGTVH